MNIARPKFRPCPSPKKNMNTFASLILFINRKAIQQIVWIA